MAALWRVYHDQASNNKPYYENSQTGAVVWEKPVELFNSKDHAIKALGWTEHQHEGKSYWSKQGSSYTTWDTPEEVQEILNRPATPPPAASHSLDHGAPTQHSYSSARAGVGAPGRSVVRHQPQRQPIDMPRASLPAVNNLPKYDSIEEAKDVFFKFLKAKGVASSWTWEQTMAACVKLPEWRAIEDPRERKQAVEKYLEAERERDAQNRIDQFKKTRADFHKMLSRHREIVYYTRWVTARPMIENDTIFQATPNEDDRKQLFFEYLLDLRKAHDKSKAEALELAHKDLPNLFAELGFDNQTLWDSANEAFMNSAQRAERGVYDHMTETDVLHAFQDYVNAREREADVRRRAEAALEFRQGRKARDGFRELLQEQIKEGDVTPKSKWSDVYPLIKDDARFAAMVEFGTNGSVDSVGLFLQSLRDLDDLVRKYRHAVATALDVTKFDFRMDTSLEELTRAAKRGLSDQVREDMGPNDYKMVYESLQDQLQRADERNRRREQKRIADEQSYLRSEIRHSKFHVRLTTPWSEVRPHVEHTKSFRALQEHERVEAYEKLLLRMQQEQEREREREDSRDRSNRHTDRHETDVYEAERKKAQMDRERNYNRGSRQRSMSPRSRSPHDSGRHRPSRRDLDRLRASDSRADPRDRNGGELDYGDGGRVGSTVLPPPPAPATNGARRRRETTGKSDERSAKRVRLSHSPDNKSKTTAAEAEKEEEAALKSGSEEGEIEEV